ncbi:exonuclease domain-containing protein [Amaricoccus solimangrovi]|uniref:DNA-directed DNA polymerase n=1 Tax=Amaricoccus solimangrovi TaxID=2589815 RepID=A0A501WFI5_9RHOB|nr:exonuclease domain-containing protein [Amaricoccus solimangrovi]TPE46844.1 DNA polymerase III subunit epsilon [Amaricoccus solimangrovi]
MKPDPRRILAALAPGAALALWLLGGALLLGATLSPEARAALGPLLTGTATLIAGWWFLAAAAGAWLAARFYEAHVGATGRLADATRLLAGDPSAPSIMPHGAGRERLLTEAINALADERRRLEAEMARRVEEASRAVALERDQLGALMAELSQSVLVCNLDGRILLYNGQARVLFRRLSRAPESAGGAELIGLGRSIHSVIDRALVTHALETIDRRRARGEAAASSQFVTTTPAGHLLRVSLAPVRSEGAAALSGYVLLVDDITDEIAAQSRRDQSLTRLTEASRASLAAMRAALEMLDFPDLEPAERESFQRVVRDEVGALSARLATLASETSEDLLTRWPLQEMLGADLVTAAAQRIEAVTGRAVAVGEVDETLWLNVDSFALTQALAFLADRLTREQDQPPLTLRLAPAAGGWGHLDLVWPTGDGAARGPRGWRTEPMRLEDGVSPLSARDVAERHGGEIWLAHERTRGLSFFRFLLPLASGLETEPATGERPEYYDFDLFAASDAARALDDRALETLSYTVFDTETTGLDPAGGDEIIQMGAVRVVNGKLLRGERFDQLVDPGRSIPEASIPFHGIRPEMVRGQPRIAEVLPAFHAFAADTVLVGHNVAFDMRFLQMKEGATGIRFDQPVLDTLLLASVAQPAEESHSLEAIATRLGVAVTARHSAAGDALTTAQVFLKLFPLLRARGIVTLGQALRAAEASYYARLRY